MNRLSSMGGGGKLLSNRKKNGQRGARMGEKALKSIRGEQ